MAEEADSTSSPREDLALIRRLMEESRSTLHGGRTRAMMWGIVVSLALLLTYAESKLRAGLPVLWIWVAAIGAGWVAHAWLSRRADRRSPVRTPTGRLVRAIWIGGGVAATVVGFGGTLSGAFPSAGALLAPIAAILGGCYYATGAACGSSPMRYIALGWWAGAVAMFVWSGEAALLVMTGLLLVFHVGGAGVFPAGGAGRPPDQR